MSLKYFDLVIAFDTEYVGGRNRDGAPLDVNSVVSYQFAFVHPDTGLKGSGLIPTLGLGRMHRRELSTLLFIVIAAIKRDYGVDIHADWIKAMRRVPRSKQRRIRVALVAHFARADLPSFKDFRRLKTSFDGVRGTYASVKRPTIRDIRTPSGARVSMSLTLFDTRLLAPAGAGSLKALGALLGRSKLAVPDVVDEQGKIVPGIERMDLARVQHPKEFHAYSIRDAELAADYFVKVAEFADHWGLGKIPPTIANAAVKWMWLHYAAELPAIIGREVKPNGKAGNTLPEARAVQNLAADTYHGGRNEAFAHGLFTETPERPFVDLDIRGCYTTAMACFREINWKGLVHTNDIALLATLDDPSVAEIEFEFPADTKYPCLPANTGDGGLIYARSGMTSATGPELLLAVNMGARIVVRSGVVAPWRERDMSKAVLPFRGFAERVNTERAKLLKGSLFELLVKELGNSLYGKLGQGVSGMKSWPDKIRIFDTRTGARGTLPPSALTSPILAAMTSGLARAVLSEILSKLPAHVRILSATTDGWLSDCTVEEANAATQGPICQHFARLRATVDLKGSGEILDVKHKALEVLVARTRHGITVRPFGGSDYLIARAGHRLEKDYKDYDASDPAARMRARAAEAAAFVDLQRNRRFDTKLEVTSFISLSKQWEENADLLDEHRQVQVALCYDMKREPVEPSDVDGLVNFQTRPWASLAEALDGRNNFDRWKQATNSVLKTSEDWTRFRAWKAARRKQGFARRTPFENAVAVAWAKGIAGFSIRTGAGGRPTPGVDLPPGKAQVAMILTGMGVDGVTRAALDVMRRREPDPTGTVDELLPGDAELLAKLLAHTTKEGMLTLFKAPLKGSVLTAVQDGVAHTLTPVPGKSRRKPRRNDSCDETVSQDAEIAKKSATAPFSSGNLDKSTRGEHPNVEVSSSPVSTAVAVENPVRIKPEIEPPEEFRTAAKTRASEVCTIDDLRHLTRVRSVLSKRFGIGRAGWMQGEKAAAKRLGFSARARSLLAVAIAVAGRVRVPEAVAFRYVAEAAAETLPRDGEAA